MKLENELAELFNEHRHGRVLCLVMDDKPFRLSYYFKALTDLSDDQAGATVQAQKGLCVLCVPLRGGLIYTPY